MYVYVCVRVCIYVCVCAYSRVCTGRGLYLSVAQHEGVDKVVLHEGTLISGYQNFHFFWLFQEEMGSFFFWCMWLTRKK